MGIETRIKMEKLLQALGFLISGAFIFEFIVLCLWWTVAQWNECKKMGMSNFYCVGRIIK